MKDNEKLYKNFNASLLDNITPVKTLNIYGTEKHFLGALHVAAENSFKNKNSIWEQQQLIMKLSNTEYLKYSNEHQLGSFGVTAHHYCDMRVDDYKYFFNELKIKFKKDIEQFLNWKKKALENFEEVVGVETFQISSFIYNKDNAATYVRIRKGVENFKSWIIKAMKDFRSTIANAEMLKKFDKAIETYKNMEILKEDETVLKIKEFADCFSYWSTIAMLNFQSSIEDYNYEEAPATNNRSTFNERNIEREKKVREGIETIGNLLKLNNQNLKSSSMLTTVAVLNSFDVAMCPYSSFEDNKTDNTEQSTEYINELKTSLVCNLNSHSTDSCDCVFEHKTSQLSPCSSSKEIFEFLNDGGQLTDNFKKINSNVGNEHQHSSFEVAALHNNEARAEVDKSLFNELKIKFKKDIEQFLNWKKKALEDFEIIVGLETYDIASSEQQNVSTYVEIKEGAEKFRSWIMEAMQGFQSLLAKAAMLKNFDRALKTYINLDILEEVESEKKINKLAEYFSYWSKLCLLNLKSSVEQCNYVGASAATYNEEYFEWQQKSRQLMEIMGKLLRFNKESLTNAKTICNYNNLYAKKVNNMELSNVGNELESKRLCLSLLNDNKEVLEFLNDDVQFFNYLQWLNFSAQELNTLNVAPTAKEAEKVENLLTDKESINLVKLNNINENMCINLEDSEDFMNKENKSWKRIEPIASIFNFDDMKGCTTHSTTEMHENQNLLDNEATLKKLAKTKNHSLEFKRSSLGHSITNQAELDFIKEIEQFMFSLHEIEPAKEPKFVNVVTMNSFEKKKNVQLSSKEAERKLGKQVGIFLDYNNKMLMDIEVKEEKAYVDAKLLDDKDNVSTCFCSKCLGYSDDPFESLRDEALRVEENNQIGYNEEVPQLAEDAEVALAPELDIFAANEEMIENLAIGPQIVYEMQDIDNFSDDSSTIGEEIISFTQEEKIAFEFQEEVNNQAELQQRDIDKAIIMAEEAMLKYGYSREDILKLRIIYGLS